MKTSSVKATTTSPTMKSPKMFLTIYCYMFIVSLTQSRAINLRSITKYSHDTSNVTNLESLVAQAVNDTSLTCSSLTYDRNTITSTLTNNIMQNIQNNGLELIKRRMCKPLPVSKLQELFNRISNPSCLQLTEFVGTFVLSTSTNCLANLSMHQECFPALNQSYCFTSTSINLISDLTEGCDYFPRFVLSVECGGCAENDRECGATRNHCYYKKNELYFHLLRRLPDQCDEQGMEVWELDTSTRSVNVGCSCKHDDPDSAY